MTSTEPEHLIGVHYPGNVVNDDRAIETLGGLNQISETFGQDKARLPLNFRPGNIYAKGFHGDRKERAGVLLKVKIRRRRDEVQTQSVEVVGKTSHCYQFESMCDFEMLPLVKATPEATAPELIYDDILPTMEQTSEEWLQNPKPMPYFMVPQVFTRYDNTDRKLFKTEKGPRIKRYLREVIRLEFSLTEPVPEKPTYDFSRKQVTPEDVELVRAHFNVQPIWSLSALVHAIPSLSRIKIKYCLPFMAYFYVCGPWRNLWVLYGYDPRKDFESRRYQIMDLRLNKRAVYNIKSRMERNKERSGGPVKNNVVSQLVYDEKLSANPDEAERYEPVFHPNKFRHLTWVNQLMYKDLYVDQIQEMLEKVPSPLNGAKLNEKSGWLPMGFDDKCREILLDILRVHFQMEMGVLRGEEEDTHGGQPPEDDDFDDDDDDEEEEDHN